MKIRDSGMPDVTTWAAFFDAPNLLDRLDFTDTRATVVDFGCGYGTFSLAAAARTTGTVYAFDIDPMMVKATLERAGSLGLANIRGDLHDFVAQGTGLPDCAVGYAMLFNILHAEDPVGLLKEAYRILCPGGKVAVTHWVYDATTPRGPDLSIRPRPEQCQAWLQQAGFELVIPFVDLPPYHYGVVARRPGDS
ncbi:MAG: class I SAM-dependent methyltransferase [Deltaproteobacteria bacterium]|nr:class I SAM-dependent methyltransferase [Deltaproteobacteria bacterium]